MNFKGLQGPNVANLRKKQGFDSKSFVGHQGPPLTGG